MHVIVGHYRLDDQSVVVGVVDKVCITFFESDVIVVPIELLCRPLVHAVNIGERPFLRLSDVLFLCSTHFFGEVRSAEDHPNFIWGLYLRCIIR